MITIEQLNAIKNEMAPKIAMRRGHGHFVDTGDGIRKTVLICGGTGCTSSSSMKVRDALIAELEANNIADEIKVVTTGCFGLCALGPIMIVYPEGTFYSMVTPNEIPEIVSEHLVKGNVVKKYLYKETVKGDEILALDQTPFYGKQKRVALRNCGVIDPECIKEYIGCDGYSALAKVLTEMTPDDVIKTVSDSGLRGRGGGGFPTGTKWKFACANRGEVKKYVVCNADEGDPGAFMDRSVLEGDPHAVLEAMAIAGYAIGADEGYIYVRAEYPIAVPSPGCHKAGKRAGRSRREHIRHRLQFRYHSPSRCRRIRLRRGNGTAHIDRGQPRRAASPSSIPCSQGSFRQTYYNK